MMNNHQITEDKKSQEKITPFKAPLTRSALSKTLLIKGENLRKFENFREKIASENPTSTEIENILLEKFIISAWKHQRAGEIEKILLNQQNEAVDVKEYNGWHETKKRRVRNIKKIRLFKEEIQHIIQYQNDLEKAMQKSLERLREEQKLSNKIGSIHKGEKK